MWTVHEMSDPMARPRIVPVTLNAVDDRIAALEAELAAISSDSGEDLDGGETQPEAKWQRGHVSKKNKRAAERAEEDTGKKKKAKRSSDEPESAPSVSLGLRCDVCNISVTSEELMREHIKGKKHKQAERAKVAKDEGRYCETCDLIFTGPDQLKEHSKGKKHREKARTCGPRR